MTITLNQVRSYVYLIADHIPDTGYAPAIANSPVDMIIAGEGPGDTQLNRSIADPTGSKLIIGYVDASEANAAAYPSLFSGSSLPSWFGKVNPTFPGNYTVQYWTTQWETALFARIDKLAAAGYDGIFIDQLSGDAQWLSGNPEGNPIHSTATADMEKLIGDIRAHVNGLHLSHPFYLLGNNPMGVIRDDPTVLKNLDAIFNEVLYWEPTASSSSYVGNKDYNYLISTQVPAYTAQGLRVFGNDYPNPTSNLQADFQGFALYTSLGWTPSVQNAFQDTDILSTGPFMYMAAPGNTTVQGSSNYVNFMSGGLQSSATLIGGSKGDFFIGGPGKNTISANAGDDTIYAHPVANGLLNTVELKFTMTKVGAAGYPQAQIKINGQIAGVVTVTADSTVLGYTPQVIDLDVSKYGPITSIEVDPLNVKWTSGSNYNNLNVNSISYAGKAMSVTAATITGSGQLTLNNSAILLNQTGVAKWTGSSIPSQPTQDTSDWIDGGTGADTVIYRAAYSHYTVTKNADGSIQVVSKDTDEGPDTLVNVEKLQFTDQTISTSSVTASSGGTSSGGSGSGGTTTGGTTGGGTTTTSHLFTLPNSATPTNTITSSATNASLTGTSGADSIAGGSGSDTLTGGAGDDTYLVNRDTDVVVEGSGAGVDTVRSYATNTVLSANVENVQLIGTSAQVAVGNASNNILIGNDVNSNLNGGAGNDILVAGAGANILSGGSGSDIFVINKVASSPVDITDFAPGVDVLDLRGLFATISYSGTDPVADGHLKFVSDGVGNTKVMYDADGSSGSGGSVQIALLDHVDPTTLTAKVDWVVSGGSSAGAGTGTGSGSGSTASHLFSLPNSATPTNTITSSATNASLTGTSGADSIAGGSGSDTLTGGAGDDTYLVNRDTDVVVENAGAGVDSVRSYATNTVLSANVENLRLIGTSAQIGVGNASNNLLVANDVDSNLSGGAGNDVLVAGAGANILNGGSGSDIFQINKVASSVVQIVDFTVGTDILDLRGLFSAAGYSGGNPVADGHLKFVSDGVGNTKVMYDADGSSGSGGSVQVALLSHVDPTALVAGWDWVYA